MGLLVPGAMCANIDKSSHSLPGLYLLHQDSLARFSDISWIAENLGNMEQETGWKLMRDLSSALVGTEIFYKKSQRKFLAADCCY